MVYDRDVLVGFRVQSSAVNDVVAIRYSPRVSLTYLGGASGDFIARRLLRWKVASGG